jgi:hypothetical protein
MAITLDAMAPSTYSLWIEEPYACTRTHKVPPHLGGLIHGYTVISSNTKREH